VSEIEFIYKHLQERMSEKASNNKIITYKTARYVIRKMRISKEYCSIVIKEMLDKKLLERENQRRLVITTINQ